MAWNNGNFLHFRPNCKYEGRLFPLFQVAFNLFTFGPAANRHNDPETGLIGNNYNGNANTDNGVQSARRVFMGGIQVSF